MSIRTFIDGYLFMFNQLNKTKYAVFYASAAIFKVYEQSSFTGGTTKLEQLVW